MSACVRASLSLSLSLSLSRSLARSLSFCMPPPPPPVPYLSVNLLKASALGARQFVLKVKPVEQLPPRLTAPRFLWPMAARRSVREAEYQCLSNAPALSSDLNSSVIVTPDYSASFQPGCRNEKTDLISKALLAKKAPSVWFSLPSLYRSAYLYMKL